MPTLFASLYVHQVCKVALFWDGFNFILQNGEARFEIQKNKWHNSLETRCKQRTSQKTT